MPPEGRAWLRAWRRRLRVAVQKLRRCHAVPLQSLTLVHLLDQVKTVMEEILEKLPEEYDVAEMAAKTTQRSPYVLVCFQECERMNLLLAEMKRSLSELALGLKVLLPPFKTKR